jgi:hypothetical protein
VWDQIAIVVVNEYDELVYSVSRFRLRQSCEGHRTELYKVYQSDDRSMHFLVPASATAIVESVQLYSKVYLKTKPGYIRCRKTQSIGQSCRGGGYLLLPVHYQNVHLERTEFIFEDLHIGILLDRM